MAYSTTTSAYAKPVKSNPLGRLADLKAVERLYGIYEVRGLCTTFLVSCMAQARMIVLRLLDPLSSTLHTALQACCARVLTVAPVSARV